MKRERLQSKRAMNFQKLKRCKNIFLLMAFLFLVAACGGGTPPASPPVKGKVPLAEKKKEGPAREVEKGEKKESGKKEETEYVYNPTGKPDPFKPFIQLTPSKVRKGTGITPLEKYDIIQLRLVAIITVPEGNIALVEDTAGKGYFVRKGTVIGRNDGKVKTVLKDRVIIEEVYQDVLGQTKVNEVYLLLHRPEEGGES